MVTVSLDIDPDAARPFLPEGATGGIRHLVDTDHATTEALGFTNVPMAIWIDEDNRIVRGPESASVERSSFKDIEIDDGWPDRIKQQLALAKSIPSHPEAYRAAIVDWAANGANSPYVLTEAELIGRLDPRNDDEAKAVAAFELGQHLYQRAGGGAEGIAAAKDWWQMAHDLHPNNWTYKRQAWTLVTTPEGKASDLSQGPNDVFTGNWLDDVTANGGGESYVTDPQLGGSS